jgi:hypothetical protein
MVLRCSKIGHASILYTAEHADQIILGQRLAHAQVLDPRYNRHPYALSKGCLKSTTPDGLMTHQCGTSSLQLASNANWSLHAEAVSTAEQETAKQP